MPFPFQLEMKSPSDQDLSYNMIFPQKSVITQSESLWAVGTDFMSSIESRDTAQALRLLADLLLRIEKECQGQDSFFKLRTLQILTNANRAAFRAGAPADRLAQHSRLILARFARKSSKTALIRYAHQAVEESMQLIPRVSSYQDTLIKDTVQYIQKHYNKPITRNHMATRLKCSPAHFSRLFRKKTGRTFKGYLMAYRMEKAKELLRNSHFNISEIAAQVGYEDPFQFSRTFRKQTEISPRKFRQNFSQPVSSPFAGNPKSNTQQ